MTIDELLGLIDDRERLLNALMVLEAKLRKCCSPCFRSFPKCEEVCPVVEARRTISDAMSDISDGKSFKTFRRRITASAKKYGLWIFGNEGGSNNATDSRPTQIAAQAQD